MAILGGAGNVAGSNPAGTGTGLNYVGDHCYGYSGLIAATNIEQTYLEFDTPSNSYIVAKVQFNYGNVATDYYVYRVYLDDQIIQVYALGSGTTQNGNDVIHLIIPGGSKIKLTAQNVTDTSDQQQAVSITGRVYT